MPDRTHMLTAILSCTNIERSQEFYSRLGFVHASGDQDYLMLSDGLGGELHLLPDKTGWVRPGQNPMGLYLYTELVDQLAHKFSDSILEYSKRPEVKPWGMYEFSLSDPDETLVRVGWPIRLRSAEE